MSHDAVHSFESPVENLKHAFKFIEVERLGQPASMLGHIIERARTRYMLTPEQARWVRWTLDPSSVSLQSKEPNGSFR